MSNELARETSPYLQQHADNPVDWQPWSEAALERARAEGKPILLSIGYSACHWCHVMAHESFEDRETADLMNRLYVNVKVDREERPDIDKIYQTAHQLFTGRGGGWPLTAFLTPDDHVPIVVGTYFPKEARYGMPPFKQVLTQVEAYYREHPEDIDARGNALLDAFGKMEAGETSTAAALTDAPLRKARERLAASFDREHGGFGGAPKFPRASCLELLLEQSRQADIDRGGNAGERSGDMLGIVTRSLNRMALGGLYDHLGGGFFRYSVDDRWSIPHFEKMLYDNAALLALYGDAYAATGETLFAEVAAETADWVVRDMQDPDGGYYATLDADSEGQEGKFYLWTPEQLDEYLTATEADLAKRVYGLSRGPNFKDPHSGTEAWHLQVVESLDAAEAGAASEPDAGADSDSGSVSTLPSNEVAASNAQMLEESKPEPGSAADSAPAPDHAAPLLDGARRKLLEARRQRVWPGRDEKLLVSWNGLMIRGMARAARHLGRPELAESATRAVDFIRERMWKDGRLLATYKDDRARFAAYLDDYAFLADGLLELLQCRWRSEDLLFAVDLADVALRHFEDSRHGGFFFTADDHEKLIHRPKPLADEAVPSGNGVLLRVLLQLGHLLGEQHYLDSAERGLAASMPMLESYPDAHASLLLALARYLQPPESIIVRGEAPELDDWKRLLDSGYHPNRSSFCIPKGAGKLPGLLATRASGPDTVAYVCQGVQCRPPVTSLETLRKIVNERRGLAGC